MPLPFAPASCTHCQQRTLDEAKAFVEVLISEMTEHERARALERWELIREERGFYASPADIPVPSEAA